MSEGIVQALPLIILRLEAATIFGASVWLYSKRQYSWKTFAAGLFLPDLAMSGYLKDTTVGAVTYNLAHSEVAPVALLAMGLAGSGDQAASVFQVGLIWMAHIGFDRMMSYGLKYSTGFGHTHLGRIG